MTPTSPPDDQPLAAALLQAVTGEAPQPLDSLEALRRALNAGRGPVWVELPWREQRPDGFVERHHLLVTRLEGDRVYFQNALGSAHPVGAEFGGSDAGPLRRREADGQESMTLRSFQSLMLSGGRALLP